MQSLSFQLLAAIALLTLAAGIAHAQATIGDCEKITAADAYNQCLAKFGPESKVKSLEPEKPSDFKSGPADAAAGAGKLKTSRHARGGKGHAHVSRGSGGRKRMTISVGGHRRRH